MPSFYTAADYGNILEPSVQCGYDKGYDYYIKDWSPYSIASGTTGDITVKFTWETTSFLLPGKEFNAKLKTLLSEDMQTITTNTDGSPDWSKITDANIVSIGGAKFPTYAWKDDSSTDGSKVVRLYSEAELILENQDSSYMYSALDTPVELIGNKQYQFQYDRRSTRLKQKLHLAYKYSNNNYLRYGDLLLRECDGIFENDENLQSVRIHESGYCNDVTSLKSLFKGCANLSSIEFVKSYSEKEMEITDDADITDMLNLKGDGTTARTAGNTLTIKNAPESFKRAAQKCDLGFNDVQLVFED